MCWVPANQRLTRPMCPSAARVPISDESRARTIQVPTFDQAIVNNAVPEAEHAFTDMMGFYVPRNNFV